MGDDERIEFVSTVSKLPREQWQKLAGNTNPFIHYDYFLALENSKACGPDTAWSAHHLVYRTHAHAISAIVPLFLKDDSWGEFVFDFNWAQAFHQNGLPYYPKLVTAVPYTPVAGPRILSKDNCSKLLPKIIQSIQQEATKLAVSSWHILFPDTASLSTLQHPSLIQRKDCQYHWFNQNYESFDQYLTTFKSSRRKKTRRERQKIKQSGISIRHQIGHLLNNDEWHDFYELYASSFYKRGRQPYFSVDFFMELAQSPDIEMLIVWAKRGRINIAASMFFMTDNTLYGRYWGCREFVNGLHFELCYYQGIEICIARQIKRFDPGVQGEHKISRGFQASPSWSVHWIQHAGFANAISDYVARERLHIDQYMQQVDSHLPFKHHDE